MEMNVNGTEKYPSKHVGHDENHNYFQIGLEHVRSDDEEPLATMCEKAGKRNTSNIVWEDTRPMFPCNKCSYGSKKKYLLLRHLKTHLSTKQKLNDENIRNNETENHVKGEQLNDAQTLNTINKTSGSKTDNDAYEKRLPCTLTCKECSYNTDKRYLFNRHVKTHSENQLHKCKVCERHFTTGASLEAHVNAHYGVKNKTCKHCEKSFITAGQLKRHKKYKHTQEKPHKCTECDYAAVERCKLQRHMRYHTGERPYQCQHCTYAAQDQFHLKRHLRTHTGEKPYKCDNCDVSFNDYKNLRVHKLQHNSSEQDVKTRQRRMYSCHLCPAKTARKRDLFLHLRRMHFSKTLHCNWCGKSFSDQYSNKLHKNQECKKCFKCQLCSFEAKKFIHLKKHMMIHTGEQAIDFENYVISKNFHRRTRHLNKTLVPKEKCHKCQKCTRTFAYKACLIRHEAFHNKKHTNAQK